MPFIVPQFIERESKIFGPFAFRQFIYVGTAGAFCIFLYFVIKSFALFLLLAILIMGASFVLAFFQTGGFPLPTVIERFFVFFSRPRVYLWNKKTIPPKIFKEKEKPKSKAREEKEESILKVSQKSHLRDLSTFLETKAR